MKNLPPVSVVGNGIMGTAIATRLLEVGHQVTVFDIDKEKVKNLVQKGAKEAATAEAAARASTFVIISLNTSSIVRRAVFGSEGVAGGCSNDTLVIDMSSIDPDSTKDMAEELTKTKGAGWVDAPLSGGAPKALLGKLTVMAGGTEANVQKAREVMDSLCANYTHMGPSGAGQTTKMVNQVLCAIGFEAVAEAVRLAEAGGVDATKLSLALAGGRADSNILQEFGPKMAARDYSPTGRIDNMMKDLEAVQSFAFSQRLALPVTSTVSDLHRLYLAAGLGDRDTTEIMKYFGGLK